MAKTDNTEKETRKDSKPKKDSPKVTDNLFATLARIQQELKAPKGQFNTFGGFAYRSCEDIVESVKPLLGDLCLLIKDEMVQVGERYYVRATATITNGVAEIKCTAFAREPYHKKGMDAAQITGATSSYARKYALNGLLAIDDTRDADSDVNMDNPLMVKYHIKKEQVAPDCPVCGKKMQLRERNDKNGVFWSCTNPNWKKDGCKAISVESVDLDGTIVAKPAKPKKEEKSGDEETEVCKEDVPPDEIPF